MMLVAASEEMVMGRPFLRNPHPPSRWRETEKGLWGGPVVRTHGDLGSAQKQHRGESLAKGQGIVSL